jgi:hypothetical protein
MLLLKGIFYGALILMGMAAISTASVFAAGFVIWSFTENSLPMLMMLAAAGLYHLCTLHRR